MNKEALQRTFSQKLSSLGIGERVDGLRQLREAIASCWKDCFQTQMRRLPQQLSPIGAQSHLSATHGRVAK
jgi:hypothetical protein